jgi:hypothetical protein
MHEATLIISIIILILIVIFLVVIISSVYNKNNSNSKNNFACVVSNIINGENTGVKCPVGQNTICDTPQCNNYTCTTPLCNTAYYATDTLPYPCNINNYFIVSNNVYFCRNGKILLINGTCPPNLYKVGGECIKCPNGNGTSPNGNCITLCNPLEQNYATISGTNCMYCPYGLAKNGKNCATMPKSKCLTNTIYGIVISYNSCNSISYSGKCISNPNNCASLITWWNPVYTTTYMP